MNENQESILHDLRANFRLEKSVETALYNALVDTEPNALSNQEFLQVLNEFAGWVLKQEES